MFTSKSESRGNAADDLTLPASFEAFYREHLPFIRSYLARRVEDPFVVADLTADVFLQVIRSAPNYRPGLGSPRAWLTGIARHCLADHSQSLARHSATVQQLQGRRLLDEDSAERIVQRIAAEAGARTVLLAIAELPPTLRSVVELVAVDGLALTDAATLLRISPGAARVRYHRARRLLQTTTAVQLHEVTS
ncbi:RNA polymerase sigma-70 factor, ECF subfamily [Friedmanniella luteola]|uniref:RNA polymerase sigma-70 factor, ECF subfamily n=1 Tax=Friedmanniella luteola TaxID=546871 RepID=A0A1H1RMK7_9ACTN|nr:RNA polymerase sigma factor [Friedmanniella luteola]SDS36882.1 RNA polymerase sigma-70 factor, ECF subfamily [Friedmanniella luteola]